jgi:uncharacterized protein involved in type VI secretion and phage assembly
MSRKNPIRKSSAIDLGRMSHGLQRPGMDTRVWSSLAYAEGDSVVADDGMFVDVVLLPHGDSLTARVPAEYAGKGFGLYAKIYENDELLIEIPRGDPAEGPVVVRRLWNKRDKPPDEAVANPEDVVLVVQKDKHLRLITSGSGKAYVKSADTVTLESPKVRLGAEDATEKLVLGNTYKGAEQQFLAQLNAAAATLTAAGASLSAAGALMVASPNAAGPIVAAAGASMTGAAATITSAATAFSAAYDTYLSTHSNTK